MSTGVASGSLSKPPVRLWLELEELCNVKCLFCYNDWRGHGDLRPTVMDTASLVAALKPLLGNLNVQYVALSGGEPLLYEGIECVLRVLREASVTAILTTNGKLGTPDRLRQLARAGLGSIQVGVHSASRKTHDHLTQRPSWDAAVRALLGAREVGLTTAIVFVATRVNVEQLSAVVRLASLIYVDKIIVNRFTVAGYGVENAPKLATDDRAVASAVQAAATLGKDIGVELELGVPLAKTVVDEFKLDDVLVPKADPSLQLTVTPSGDVKFCSQSPVSLGKIGDTHGVLGLLHSWSQRNTHGCHCAAMLREALV